MQTTLILSHRKRVVHDYQQSDESHLYILKYRMPMLRLLGRVIFYGWSTVDSVVYYGEQPGLTKALEDLGKRRAAYQQTRNELRRHFRRNQR